LRDSHTCGPGAESPHAIAVCTRFFVIFFGGFTGIMLAAVDDGFAAARYISSYAIALCVNWWGRCFRFRSFYYGSQITGRMMGEA